MAKDALKIEGRSLRINCKTSQADLFLLFANISEGMSKITEIEAEFLTNKLDLDGQKLLAESFEFEMDVPQESTPRYWSAMCVECTSLGESTGMGFGTYHHFRIKLRSWPWFLTRTADCRIFQEMKTDDIIKEVFKDANFSDYKFNLSNTPPTRNYCVQYRESDLEFIVRLMESEGMFFFFEYVKGKHTLMISDDSAGLKLIKGEHKIPFLDHEAGQRTEMDFIHKWEEKKRFETGTVTLMDYNFTISKTEVKGTRKGVKDASKYEIFDYPGKFEESGVGAKIARRKIQAISAGNLRTKAEGLVNLLTTGGKLILKDHPQTSASEEQLVVAADHKLRLEMTDEIANPTDKTMQVDQTDMEESHSVEFEVQPAKTAYAPLESIAFPKIFGIQTAVVVGPKGEEIYTDKYGRIKVQFHWDRLGKNDDKSSCWIRVATPMGGKNWGMVHVPRIGMEVMVQFEEGDPDRPIVTGALYNDFNTPPVTLPANKTQMGFVSDTHKNTDTKAFHEIILEDDKDKEFIRMQSEKDLKIKIKNNTEITYGTGDKDQGKLKLDVWKDTEETYGVGAGAGFLKQKVQDNFEKKVLIGDYILDVGTGNRVTTIATDDSLTVGSNQSISVGADKTETIGANKDVTVGAAMTVTAATKIKFVCGGSTIEMTPNAIKMSSIVIKADASVSAKITGGASATLESGGAATLEGSAVAVVKGGLVKIN